MQRSLSVFSNSHYSPASIPMFIAVLMAVAVPASTAQAQQGDMNCDGVVNTADVPLFVEALLGTTGFGGCDISRADMNADAMINAMDTQRFVDALLAPACPGGLVLCSGVCTNPNFDGSNCGGCGIVCDDPNKGCCSGGICQSCW